MNDYWLTGISAAFIIISFYQMGKYGEQHSYWFFVAMTSALLWTFVGTMAFPRIRDGQ